MKLPERPKDPIPTTLQSAWLPKWQVLQDVDCFTDAACTNTHHAGHAVQVGYTVTEYDSKDGAICIRLSPAVPRADTPALWVRPVGADSTYFMTKLSEREAHSKIAAIYKVGRKGDVAKGGGETLLYHGSGLANSLSILSQGLRVKPPGAMHHGSAFGNGIYFSNSFAKSRDYCALDTGVGFMLLCEVSVGKSLEGRGFNFARDVRNAHIAVARRRLGLGPEVTVAENSDFKEAVRKIDEFKCGEVEDISGTECDSFHMLSGMGPDPAGDVVHPDGYRVPCGETVNRAEGGGNGARDEIIVYESSRVCVRYVIELRDCATAMKLKPVKRPDGTVGDAGGAATEEQQQQQQQQEDEDEDSEVEDEDEEVDADEDEDEDE